MSTLSFIGNPYNILGLPSDSSSSDIRKRIGLIDKMLAIDEPVSFDSDVFLDSSERTASVIKDCEKRLNDPKDSLLDAFFWFADNPDAIAAAAVQDREYFKKLGFHAATAQPHDYTEEKNAAVGLSIIFEKTQGEGDFEAALSQWTKFVHLDSFWDYWEKYYKSIDRLDTNRQLIQELRENIDSIITERFFEVSGLDDLIDAQIVGRYFVVSADAAEKAAEEQLGNIRELRFEAETLQSSLNKQGDGESPLSEAVQQTLSSLISRSVELHEGLMANKQDEAGAVERELNNLWNDLHIILVSIHNGSIQKSKLSATDIEFLKQATKTLCQHATDINFIKKTEESLEVLDGELPVLQAFESPLFRQLEGIAERLGKTNASGEELVALAKSQFNSFRKIYQEIDNEGLLYNPSFAEMIEVIATLLNVTAVKICNEAQDNIESSLHMLEKVSALLDRSAHEELLHMISSNAAKAARAAGTARKILGFLNSIPLDPELKDIIKKNLDGAKQARDSFTDLGSQCASALNQSMPGHGSGGCYIATAVYGSYDCPQVWVLRRFRDHSLAKSFWGRLFIHLYYATSPLLVRLFGNTCWFKTLCSKPLKKLVKKCKERGYADTPYQDQIW